ncbi:unnamed protein product [Heterosigma akashiwo]
MRSTMTSQNCTPFLRSSTLGNPISSTAAKMARRVHVISSQGTQQGDPAGPFLFCLGLKAVLAKLQRELQGPCAILGLMDDVTVLLPSDQAEEAWNKAKACFQEYGLTLRADKSKLLPLDARGLNGHDQFPGRQTLIAASAEKPSGKWRSPGPEPSWSGSPTAQSCTSRPTCGSALPRPRSS